MIHLSYKDKEYDIYSCHKDYVFDQKIELMMPKKR